MKDAHFSTSGTANLTSIHLAKDEVGGQLLINSDRASEQDEP